MCTFILQSYTIEMNITVRNETHSVRYETIIKTPVIARPLYRPLQARNCQPSHKPYATPNQPLHISIVVHVYIHFIMDRNFLLKANRAGMNYAG